MFFNDRKETGLTRKQIFLFRVQNLNHKMSLLSSQVLILLLTVVQLFVGVYAPDPIPKGQCTKINACSCTYGDGTIVNLEPLDRKDGKPNFSNTTNDAKTEYYSWNPCTPFTYEPGNNTECENVAVCMIHQGIPRELFYDLGDQDSAQFNVDSNGTLKLTYTADKGDYTRVTEISLQCMATLKIDLLVPYGEQDENNNTVLYKLVLVSKYSCAYAPDISPAETVSPLNAGEIVAIIIFGIIGAYLFFGFLYQALIKKESGKRLCPNHELWCNLPNKITGSEKKGPLLEEAGAKYDAIE